MHPVLRAVASRWKAALGWTAVFALVEVLAATVAVVLPLAFALAAAGRFAIPALLAVGGVGLLVRAVRRRRDRRADRFGLPHLPVAARTGRTADLAVHAVLLANAGLAAALLLAPVPTGPDDVSLKIAAIVPGVVAVVGAPWSVWLTWRSALDRTTLTWEAGLAGRATRSPALAHGLLVRRWTIRVSLALNSGAAVVLLAQDPWWG